MDKQITIYHGSEKIVEKPVYGDGGKNNDFGPGFYCTGREGLAREWAVTSERDGFINRYSLDTESLRVLNLNSPDYTILNWMAVLLEHRLFSIKVPVAKWARRYLLDHFSVNVNAFDLIIGYRGDDSCFDYAESFLNNMITLEQLDRVMRLGNLGDQIVLKSKYAISRLKFEGYDAVKKVPSYVLRRKRLDEANRLYWEMPQENYRGLYIQDMIRGDITNEDPRIPRNLS